MNFSCDLQFGSRLQTYMKCRDVKASRLDWPSGQKFGLGLELLALASTLWPRPQGFWPRPRYILATKRRRTALFGHYRTSSQLPEPGTDKPSKQLRYITYINSDTFDHSLSELAKLYCDFLVLQLLFDRLFCIPASSVPVERVFSQSGLIMTARRAHMSNAVLESLTFLKCNADI